MDGATPAGPDEASRTDVDGRYAPAAVDDFVTFALVIKALDRELHRRVNEAMLPLGITGPQSEAITVIGQAGRLSLKQLGESFQAEVQPMVVEVEGRTLQLQGTAEEQFREWRQLLKELYENETGLPVQAPAAAAETPSAPAPASGG